MLRIMLLCVLLAVGVGCPGTALGGLGQAPRAEKTDLQGDPLPAGAIARLGTTRFRHGSYLKGLVFLPDSTALVSASEDRSIRFWDSHSGRLLRKLSIDSLEIRAFALSPDGRLIAVAGFWYPDDGAPHAEARLLDVASGKTVRSLPRDVRDADRHALAFTPDGKLLISLGVAGTLRIEEVATGTEILQQRFAGNTSASLALAPDGSTLAINSGTGKLYVWKWDSGEEPRELMVVGRSGAAQFSFSPDGKQVAACGGVGEPIRVWDVESGRLAHQFGLPSRDEYVRGNVVFTPDGMTVFAPGSHRNRGGGIAVHWWNAATGEYQGRLDVQGGYPLAMSPDGRLLAAGTDAGAYVWRWPARDEVIPSDAAHRESVNRLVVAPDGTIISAGEDDTIRLWDSATGKQKRRLHHDYWIGDIALSPNGAQLVSLSLDTVRLWDLATGREIYRLPGHGRQGGTGTVAFSADGQRFASFGGDFNLRIWDVRTGKALSEHKLQPTGVKVPEEGKTSPPNPFFRIDQAGISRDASLLAFSLRRFFVFDVGTGQELHVLENTGSHVMSLAISPDSRYVLASAWGKPIETTLPDGRRRTSTAKQHPVMLWDLSSGRMTREIMLPAGGVGPVAFSADGLRFAVSTSQPKDTIAIYDAASGREQLVIDDVPHRVASLAFAPDGRTLVSGLRDSTAIVWDLEK